MATTKLKGTSKKIKELKGIKPEKITDKQLKNIQDTVNSINRTQLEVGNIELKKHEMLHAISNLRENLMIVQKELEKEYGTYDVDIQTGIINYPKENGEVNKED